MTDSGVTRTVRQRGLVVAGVGYAIQFLSAMALVWSGGGTTQSGIAGVLLLVLLVPTLSLTLWTYARGIRYKKLPRGGHDVLRQNRMNTFGFPEFFSVIFAITGAVRHFGWWFFYVSCRRSD